MRSILLTFIVIWVGCASQAQTIYEPIFQNDPGGKVNTMCFSVNASLLYYGDESGTIHVMDVRKGLRIKSWNVFETAVHEVSLSPDGRTLVILGGDRIGTSLKVIDAQSGKLLYERNEWRVTSVDFSEDALMLALLIYNNETEENPWIEILGTRNGNSIVTIRSKDREIFGGVKFAEGGERLGIHFRKPFGDRFEHYLRIWNVQENKAIYTFDNMLPYDAFNFDPKEKKWISFSLRKGNESKFYGPGDEVYRESFSVNSGKMEKLYPELAKEKLQVSHFKYDFKNELILYKSRQVFSGIRYLKNESLEIYSAQESLSAIAIGKSGRLLATAGTNNNGSNFIKIKDLSNGKLVQDKLPQPLKIRDLGLHEAHNGIYISGKFSMQYFNLENLTLNNLGIANTQMAQNISFNDVGTKLGWSGSYIAQEGFYIKDLESGEIQSVPEKGTGIFSNDLDRIAYNFGEDFIIKDLAHSILDGYWDIEMRVFEMCRQVNGNLIAIAGYDRLGICKIMVWDLEKRKEVGTLLAAEFITGASPKYFPFAISFSPNGNELLIASSAQIIQWEYSIGKLNRKFDTEYLDKLDVFEMAVSTEMKLVAVSGNENGVHLFSLNELLDEVLVLPKSKKVRYIYFGSGGKLIFGIESSGALKIWSSTSGNLLATLLIYENGKYIVFSPGGCFYAEGMKDVFAYSLNGRILSNDKIEARFERKDKILEAIAKELID